MVQWCLRVEDAWEPPHPVFEMWRAQTDTNGRAQWKDEFDVDTQSPRCLVEESPLNWCVNLQIGTEQYDARVFVRRPFTSLQSS